MPIHTDAHPQHTLKIDSTLFCFDHRYMYEREGSMLLSYQMKQFRVAAMRLNTLTCI